MLTRNQFIVKEHVGLLKFSDTYDIIDPATGTLIGQAKEKVAAWVHLLRLVMNKQQLPTTIQFINQPDDRGAGEVVLSIRRGFTFFRAKVQVFDANEKSLGYFKAKFLSIGGGFHIYDPSNRKLGEVKGDWKGWNFKLLDTAGLELGTVTKKWAGLGKELFTSADTYVISLTAGADGTTRALLLAAGLAIDTIYKER